MAVDPALEHWIGLSVAKELRDLAALAGKPVQVQGLAAAVAEDAEEWVALDPLSITRPPSRRGTWKGSILFQVACLAKYGSERADGQLNAPWQLAASVRAGLEKRDLAVKKYGAGDAQVGALTVREGACRYLPGPAGSRTHGVILTFEGTLTST